MMSLFDQVLTATVSRNSAPTILGENHDRNKINAGGGEGTTAQRIAALEAGGWWDAAEYGISREQQIERLKAANTPEKQEAELAMMRRRANDRAGIDFSNGRANIVVSGKLPWHGLGVNVAEAMTWEHASRLGGLDWRVEKQKLFYEFEQGRKEAAGQFGLIRSDTGTILDVCAAYKPIQNAEAFGFLDEVLQEHGAHYEVAGSLFGGKQIFMVAKMPRQSFAVNGGDQQDAYVVFTNPHTVGKAAKCFSTSVRPECANTLRLATSRDGDKGLSICHTGDIKRKIAQAQSVLGLAVRQFDTYRERCEEMTQKPVKITHFANEVLDAVLDITQAQANMGADLLASTLEATQIENKFTRQALAKKIERRGEILTDILNRYESEKNGRHGMRGTAWAAFNAVTDHVDHNRIGRNSSDQETWQSRRFEAALIGEGDEMKQAAYRIATASA